MTVEECAQRIEGNRSCYNEGRLFFMRVPGQYDDVEGDDVYDSCYCSTANSDCTGDDRVSSSGAILVEVSWESCNGKLK